MDDGKYSMETNWVANIIFQGMGYLKDHTMKETLRLPEFAPKKGI